VAEQRTFLVVGLGASAGGLEAFEHFFREMPDDTGMAFVIVTHLARGQISALPDILSRYTPMKVVTPSADTPLAVDTVYVCPPDFIITQSDRTLRLHERGAETQIKPIDIYLTSLAEDCRERAIGVLLSGGGTDGTLGFKAIKEKGGVTIAQGSDGSAPMQSHMPDSAIAAGTVDMVLSSDDMAGWLSQYAANFERYSGLAESDVDDNERSNTQTDEQKPLYDSIYRLLFNQVGHDFSGYKERTFIRRVRRRMQMLQLDDLAAYVQRLRDTPDEVSQLFSDLLIGVTNFFRDPRAFAALEKNVIPKLFEDKGAGDHIRIWVPGCATGEEVYSLAILMREQMETMRAAPRVQIFATDIDEAALNVARSGRYPVGLLANVSPQRLQHFFDGDDVSRVVTKALRDLCVFSSHSVIRDPPFSRIDLISCRNLLIYLAADFQAQIIPVFHFALRPKGYLFLGTSENVTQHGDLFASVDKKQRIFQRRENAAETHQHITMFPLTRRREPGTEKLGRSRHARTEDLRHAAESRVLDRFAPAHVIVNNDGDVLHYSLRTGKYLEPPAGLPNRQLLALARRGLRVDLRAALREAAETRRPARRDNVLVELDDRVQPIDLTVEPFGDDAEDPLFLVLFADVAPPRAAGEHEELQQQSERHPESK
jgi:two-component system CheB/CheR fusion protein